MNLRVHDPSSSGPPARVDVSAEQFTGKHTQGQSKVGLLKGWTKCLADILKVVGNNEWMKWGDDSWTVMCNLNYEGTQWSWLVFSEQGMGVPQIFKYSQWPSENQPSHFPKLS